MPPAGAVLERLRAHALVSPRHYTAHPQQQRRVVRHAVRHLPARPAAAAGGSRPPEVNGLFSGLPADVGLRGVYLPSLYQIDLDDRMSGPSGPAPSTSPIATSTIRCAPGPIACRRLAAHLGGDRMNAVDRDRLRTLLVDDLQALERVKADIARTACRRQAATRSCSSRRSGTGRGRKCRPTTRTCWPAGGC